MKEKLKLKNGHLFDIPVNGIKEKTSAKSLLVEIVVPEEMTLEQVKAEFSNKAALQELTVVKEESTIMIFTGYTKLGSRVALDSNAAVEVRVTENEDGTAETTTVYAAVAELELFQEPLEEKVEANRADIDFLLMMGE
ncbi:MAG: hypothetical protein Q4C84_15235 [Bacillota bacterium]|nr:hypothetical protein [Bacillota bacterium]